MVTQKVDAIVINVDPAQVQAGLQAAKAANIPVFGMDAGADPLLVTNVTSNGYAMAAETSTYVADRIGGKGNVVMFCSTLSRRCRCVASSPPRCSATTPTSRFSTKVTPDVSDGGIADSPRQDGSHPRRQPHPGSISCRVGRVGPAGPRRPSGDCRRWP